MSHGTAECPCCHDLLVGFNMEEALDHLLNCCRERGYYVLGVKPTYADMVYEELTGERPPQMEMHERVQFYWEEA